VQRIAVSSIPALNAQLQQKDDGSWEWVVPELRVTPWPLAFKTKSGSLLYPDGSTAHLRSRNTGENADIYGRLVMVIEVDDPPKPGCILTDEQHWILADTWKAREYWIAEYTERIANIKKKEDYAELYAPTLESWRSELAILQNDHFSVPEEVTVEPPFEPIVLPKIAEEVPQRPEQRPATEPRVDVLDAATHHDLARSLDAFTALETYGNGRPDFHEEMNANAGYAPPTTSAREIAERTCITTDAAVMREHQRGIIRARKTR
jgi:hypothetical protein